MPTACEAAVDLTTEVAALRALAESQHQEVIQKLEHRFQSLEQHLTKSPPHWSHGKIPELHLSPGVSDLGSNGCGSEQLTQVTQESNEARKNYVSFASFDELRKECTDAADAHRSRKKFAAQKTQSAADACEGRASGRTVQKRKPLAAVIVGHSAFDAFFGLVVITNAIFIGIDLEFTLSPQGGRPAALDAITYVFTFLFTVELILRMRAADGYEFFCSSEDWHWNYLDMFIVVSSLWEVLVDLLNMLGEQGVTSLAGISSMKAFRIIRITRVVKTVRIIRLFRFVLKLRTLITSIASTLTSLLWAMVLLALVIYVFAILFAQTVNDYLQNPEMMDIPMQQKERDAAEQYFKDLLTTMLSLFMSIAGGVSWEEVIAPLISISSIWAWVFLFYFFFTYFAVLNVVTAVFCQSAIDSAQSDHTMMVQSILDDKEAHLEKIQTLFSKMASEKGGGITFAMFEEKINSAAVKEYFATLGLDVWDAWSFFKLLDADAGGSVEIEEFLMGCLRLRGQATAIDVGKILQDQEWLIQNQDSFFRVLNAELQELKMELASLRFLSATGGGSCFQGRSSDL